MPGSHTNVLDYCNSRWSQLVLYAQTELISARIEVVVRQVLEVAWEERRRSSRARLVTGVRIREVDGAYIGLICIRRICVRAVDIVALYALEKLSETPADHCLAISEEVIGKTDTRLHVSVVVLYDPSRESIHARQLHAVQIERNRCARRLAEARTIRIQLSSCRIWRLRI